MKAQFFTFKYILTMIHEVEENAFSLCHISQISLNKKDNRYEFS